MKMMMMMMKMMMKNNLLQELKKSGSKTVQCHVANHATWGLYTCSAEHLFLFAMPFSLVVVTVSTEKNKL